ncbi:MAG: C39 family peptidase, partial [Patescibacteria group bacterium]
WELDTFGFFKDTTAAQTAQMVEGLYGGTSVQLLTNPTVAELKSAIAAGQPVVVPAAGRLLKNPNFKRPGPLYHMLVLKGYTKDGRFITNDPGTRRGADYLYDPEVIMNAMHDWNGGDVDQGAKVALVVSR